MNKLTKASSLFGVNTVSGACAILICGKQHRHRVMYPHQLFFFSWVFTAGKGNRYSGGNPYCPRPTPDWQKEITKFFTKVPRTNQLEKENLDPEDAGAGSSKMEG